MALTPANIEAGPAAAAAVAVVTEDPSDEATFATKGLSNKQKRKELQLWVGKDGIWPSQR